MNWSARITGLSELNEANEVTYTFVCVGDGVDKSSEKSVTGAPGDVQIGIANAVKAFAEAWELSQTLPQPGDVLEIVIDG